MVLFLNTKTDEPSQIWYGGNALSRVYRGSTQVWPRIWTDLRVTSTYYGLGGALIRESDKTMWVVGNNDYGCLGLGHESNIHRFALVPDAGPWKDVHVGYYRSWAVKTDGSLWYAGRVLSEGFLPAGKYQNWTRINAVSNVKSVACGFYSGDVAFFIRENGDVYGCGQMVSLAPELASTTSIINISGVIGGAEQIECNAENMIVLKQNGSVWTSGRNANGLCGNGTTAYSDFQQIMTGVKQVAACSYFFSILKTDGTIWWCGQCPDGTTRTEFASAGISNVKKLYRNQNALFLIKNNGELWNIGYNSYGEFGIGTSDDRHTSFIRTPDLLVDDIGGGYSVNYIRTTDGAILSAGRNQWGQLAGGGTTTYKKVAYVW